MVYHVLNRSGGRRRLFTSEADYVAFLRVLVEALRRYPGVQLLAFCIMPNHWHLVLRPCKDGELSAFMRWLTQTHAQRWRQVKQTVGEGSLYQGRFKSFVVEEDHHFLVLCRYVERNALRAKLVRRAEAWRWGSAWTRGNSTTSAGRELGELLADWPVPRPATWLAILNEPQSDRDEERVRTSIARGRPLGGDTWVERTARRMSITHALRPPGRPAGAKDRQSRHRTKQSHK
jgi:putative transposase